MNLPRFEGFVRVFVLICIGIFGIEMFLHIPENGPEFFHNLLRFFGLVPELLFKGMIYQLLTWVFFHGNITHLLFNMLGFWMFGSLLQDYLGHRRFFYFCLSAAIISGVIVALAGLFSEVTWSTPTIGASGIVFAILIAVSRLFPDQVVLFMFIFPMRMQIFALLLIGLEFYALWQSNQGGVSNIAHLGGALFGWLAISRKTPPGSFKSSGGFSNWFRTLKDRWHQRKMRRKLRVVRSNEAIKRWN